MPSIISRTVNASTKILAAQFNALRSDVLDNHDHDGVKGTNVNHGNLLYESGYSASNTHEEIDDHIAASTGQHGHNTNVHVAGVSPNQMSFVIWTYESASTDYIGDWAIYTFDLPVTMADATYQLVAITARNKPGVGGNTHSVNYYVTTQSTTQISVQMQVERDQPGRKLNFNCTVLSFIIVGRVAS